MLTLGVGAQGATLPFAYPQMLRGAVYRSKTSQPLTCCSWLLTNVPWVMLTAHSIFGVSAEDGADMVKHCHNTGFELHLATSKQSQ